MNERSGNSTHRHRAHQNARQRRQTRLSVGASAKGSIGLKVTAAESKPADWMQNDGVVA